MEKQYKYRIYPTRTQEAQIQNNFNAVRYVYNHYLDKRITAYQNNKEILSLNECTKDLTQLKKAPGYEWLNTADDNALRYALRDLDNAYTAFFRSVKQGDYSANHPKFKPALQTRQSYRSKNNIVRQSIRLYEDENKMKLPKLGYVKCKASRPPEGRILFATISHVPSGKYYATLCCTDITPTPLPKTNSQVGIHMGIKTIAALSDGAEYENLRAYEKTKTKISRLSRQLARKTKNSKNYEKARLKLAKAHEKTANQRNDFIHKLTTELIKEHDLICVRDESYANKTSKPWFAKHAADAGHSPFVRQLEYKSNWYEKDFVKINATHPSVQLCSTCGYKNPQTKTNPHQARWTCPACNTIHNRKTNAAKNILTEGTNLLSHPLRPDGPEITPAE